MNRALIVSGELAGGEISARLEAWVRGRLRVYLGAAPGVGKSHAMLDEGLRRQERGTQVVIGLLDTAGRPDLGRLAEPFEQIRPPPGGGLAGIDVEGLRRRQPVVVLVDALARRAADGHARWEAVEELLASGIDVVTPSISANWSRCGTS